MTNSVTVFSNGIADFVRKYPIKKSEKLQISIPVKKDNVADVLASLNVIGDVKLDSPASFSPSNSGDKGELFIDTYNVVVDLATKLSGSKVAISLQLGDKPTRGTLMGVHNQEYISDGEKVSEYYIILMDESSCICRFPLDEVQSIKFLEEAIQSEVNKALQKNLQAVKPNSKFVDLTLTSTQDTEATIQYSVPVAAWKISYRLVRENDAFTLKGLAIVDNDTEEDWKDVLVSVVTGEPITFSTDLAVSKTPRRSHVNIVNENAAGAVEVESGINLRSSGLEACSRGMGGGGGGYATKTMSLVACAAPVTVNAMQAEASIKEVGDYSVFTAKNPVSIASNKSAVIPVFDADLKDTKNVLHYNPSNNESRAYSSLLIKNETEHALGRGVCTVYFDGLYAGNCVIPALKKNEENLVPYAIETGVKVMKNLSSSTNNQTSVQITNGLYVSKWTNVSEYLYTFEKNKSDAFDVFLDHQVVLQDNTSVDAFFMGEIVLKPEKVLSNGLRFKFPLTAENITVSITERKVSAQSIQLGYPNMDWFLQQVTNGSIKNIDELKPIIQDKNKIAKVEAEIDKNVLKIEKITAKADRLRKNIELDAGETKKKEWVNELSTCENSINELEDSNTKLVDEVEHLTEKINQELTNLTIEMKLV